MSFEKDLSPESVQAIQAHRRKTESGTLMREEQEKIAARRGRDEQYKHQYLMTEIVED
jgi:hypothetical protein